MNQVGMQEYTLNAHYNIYVNRSQGEICAKQGELSKLSSLRSDGSRDSQIGGSTLRDTVKSTQNLASPRGAIKLESTQISGLVMAWQEAGPRERWLKTLKGEFENNCRKPRDLVRK